MNITKFQLMTAFFNRQRITIKGVDLACIDSIQHEDGSGKSFNITGRHYAEKDSYQLGVANLHIRTID